MWVKRLDLLQKIELNDFFGAEDTLLPVQNGNIKFKSLEFIWELFGYLRVSFQRRECMDYSIHLPRIECQLLMDEKPRRR